MASHSVYYKGLCDKTLATVKADYDEIGTYGKVAKKHGVWPSEIRRAVMRDYASPALVKAVCKPVTRVRFSGDVSPELRDKLRAEAARCGLTNGELIDMLWTYWGVRDWYDWDNEID